MWKTELIFIQPKYMSKINRTAIVIPSASYVKGDLKFFCLVGTC